EPGLDTGYAAETWMDSVLLDLLKPGITMVARSPQCPIEDGAHRRSRWTGTGRSQNSALRIPSFAAILSYLFT
ncbi:hypothetical protein, partial [Sphingobacterium sp. UBA5980]|uniref:hypothetical protein n=1 Tax=Sphingobacterium sp. UBA5980 TaxID=1947504 RepID=UPI002579DB17